MFLSIGDTTAVKSGINAVELDQPVNSLFTCGFTSWQPQHVFFYPRIT